MTINSSPVLTGESARVFVEEAERNGKLPTPCLSLEREAQIAEFLRKSREFIFPPKERKNGFKLLYKTEQEERSFLELNPEEPLETRFMFFDLKLN